MSKKEIAKCEIEMDLKNFFLRSNQSNDNIISAYRPGLKTGVGNSIFFSEIGSRFGAPGGTPSTRIPRSTPRVITTVFQSIHQPTRFSKLS